MRALSVRNPWAWALVAGHKSVENRDWKLPRARRGERVLIHCGKHRPDDVLLDFMDQWAEDRCVVVPAWARRAIGGVVGSLIFDDDVTPQEVTSGREWVYGDRCWVVRPGSAVEFREPIRCAGALGFFQAPQYVVRRLEVEQS